MRIKRSKIPISHSTSSSIHVVPICQEVSHRKLCHPSSLRKNIKSKSKTPCSSISTECNLEAQSSSNNNYSKLYQTESKKCIVTRIPIYKCNQEVKVVHHIRCCFPPQPQQNLVVKESENKPEKIIDADGSNHGTNETTEEKSPEAVNDSSNEAKENHVPSVSEEQIQSILDEDDFKKSEVTFVNESVDLPSPKESLVTFEEVNPESRKPGKSKLKKLEKERSLSGRLTFSSIGFLVNPLKSLKQDQLTKEEIEKYKKRKGKFDRPSAGGLPTFHYYGALFEKKIFNFGEPGSGLRIKGDVQDFQKLRNYYLLKETLFEDPEFPPVDSSLFYNKAPHKPYEWKRPVELIKNPKFFADGYSRFDVQQGRLGDCWLLAAAANLTLHRKLFFQVVPTDQNFTQNYAGIFHFRFWQYGRWIDVVIDDRLPTCNGQLVYLRSNKNNEFWSALLEKAYAKLHGSYEALIGGTTCEAMEDFTGGISERYELDNPPSDLFKIILKAYDRCSLMSCSMQPDPKVPEAKTPEGLVRGHAYSITSVKYVDINRPEVAGKIGLLRLRNPWGDATEWNGAWSDKSPEWKFISDTKKDELGLTFEDDGEFWMSYKDFLKQFDELTICNIPPDSFTKEELVEGHKKRWEMAVFEGEWVNGVTAGGCCNYPDTFWMNPQYRYTVIDPDDDDPDKQCSVIIALMQKNRRAQRIMGKEQLPIAFVTYYLRHSDITRKSLDRNFFRYNSPAFEIPSYTNLREVSCRYKLRIGTYLIVPTTYEPNEECEFLLRVISEHKNKMEENIEEVKMGDMDDSVIKKHEPTIAEIEEDDKARDMFYKLSGKEEEIGWMELKQILDGAMKSELSKSGFSKDTCRSMVAMMDSTRSGKLIYGEFRILWVDIRNWKYVFKSYDKKKSGVLSGMEFRNALKSAGYQLNNHILNILMHRYGTKKGVIGFEDFIMCAVKVATMLQLFKDFSVTDTAARVKLEQWLENTLYA